MSRPRSALVSGNPAERRPGRLAALLPTLRHALEDQRDFRVEQITQIDADDRIGLSAVPSDGLGGDPHTAPALREVRAIVRSGAQRALRDIELALARMRTGAYGDCRACGVAIDLGVLRAIPTSTMCLTCHSSLADPTSGDGGRGPRP